MKTISQMFAICLLALSTTIIQASHRPNRPSFFPQLTRKNHVAIINPLLTIRQQETSPITSITPVTIGSYTSISPSLPTPTRISTPRSISTQLTSMYTQEYVDDLITSNAQLTNKNNEFKTQLAALTEVNKTLTATNQNLLLQTKTQQDKFSNRIHKAIICELNIKNQMIMQQELINNQDIELVQQSNEIIALKARINQLKTNSSAFTSQN